jgi:hypothetical protein
MDSIAICECHNKSRWQMKGPAMITPTPCLVMREDLWGVKGGLIALIHIIMANSGCRGMCLTRFARLDLKFPIFLLQNACCDFLSQYAYCDVQYVCNMHIAMQYSSFLLNQKGLESMSILHKNFCNMHIARLNMHIAIESILPLTYIPGFKNHRGLRTTH